MKANNEYLPKNLDIAVKESHVSVLAYAHREGAHYVAIEYVDGVYNIYNPFEGNKGPWPCYSLDIWMAEGNFLPISLVTIPKSMPQPPRPIIYTDMI